jgi:hypothetical protein
MLTKKIPDNLSEQLSIVSPILSEALKTEESLINKYSDNFAST